MWSITFYITLYKLYIKSLEQVGYLHRNFKFKNTALVLGKASSARIRQWFRQCVCLFFWTYLKQIRTRLVCAYLCFLDFSKKNNNLPVSQHLNVCLNWIMAKPYTQATVLSSVCFLGTIITWIDLFVVGQHGSLTHSGSAPSSYQSHKPADLIRTGRQLCIVRDDKYPHAACEWVP